MSSRCPCCGVDLISHGVGVMSCANLSSSWPLAGQPVLWGFFFASAGSISAPNSVCFWPLGCDFEDGGAGFAHPLSRNSSLRGQTRSRSPLGKRQSCTKQGCVPRGDIFLALPARAKIFVHRTPFCSLPTCAAPFTLLLAELGRFLYTPEPLLGVSNPEPAPAGTGG